MKLRMWYMVHAKLDVCPNVAGMCNAIRPPLADLQTKLASVEGPWQRTALFSSSASLDSVPIVSVGRYFPGDEGYFWNREGMIDELRKTMIGPHSDYVFDHLRQTSQSFTITPGFCNIGPSKMARICEQLCGHLAETTCGLIHVFQEGFFDRNGESLLPYNPKHRLKTR